MAALNETRLGKTVADPLTIYESMHPLWSKSRAVCGGERFVKDLDSVLDVFSFKNLLIPFSPSMTQLQYNFYKAEAELPGIVSQYAKTVIGGLLRKQPQLVLPKDAPADAYNWIMNEFAQDCSPLISFLDRTLWEEVQTSRAWVYLDYPNIGNSENLTQQELLKYKPYPVLWKAESVINWDLGDPNDDGSQDLVMVIVRNYESVREKDEFHAKQLDTVWVHEIVDGCYQIRKFQSRNESAMIPVINGQIQQNYGYGVLTNSGQGFILVDTITNIMMNGERLNYIPAWPVNGSVQPVEPILIPLIDKEIALYNKISRRNHLLYGAATYTPVICSDMDDDKFKGIVGAGLGTWLHLQQGDTATVLETPTESLKDMDRSIAAAFEEMAKMGIRMLAPEVSQSGVALDIRNAAQTAQLGTFNIKVSNQFASIIACMLNWRYGTKYTAKDVKFMLSADFNPAPLGADWLRLITEWYQQGLIPRSIWILIMKHNDILEPDYDDEEGKTEINQDELIQATGTSPEVAEYAAAMQQGMVDDPTIQQENPVQAKKKSKQPAQLQ